MLSHAPDDQHCRWQGRAKPARGSNPAGRSRCESAVQLPSTPALCGCASAAAFFAKGAAESSLPSRRMPCSGTGRCRFCDGSGYGDRSGREGGGSAVVRAADPGGSPDSCCRIRVVRLTRVAGAGRTEGHLASGERRVADPPWFAPRIRSGSPDSCCRIPGVRLTPVAGAGRTDRHLVSGESRGRIRRRRIRPRAPAGMRSPSAHSPALTAPCTRPRAPGPDAPPDPALTPGRAGPCAGSCPSSTWGRRR